MSSPSGLDSINYVVSMRSHAEQMPHGRIDAKYDQKKRLGELNELAVGYSPTPLGCGFALIVDRNCTIATSECQGLYLSLFLSA